MVENKKKEKIGRKISCHKMTDDEIKQLAEDMYRHLIFTDRQLQNKSDLTMVFTPLIFLSKDQLAELKNNPPGMIYEYIDKAGPMSINGMPIFSSFSIISQEDTRKVIQKYNEIVDMVKKI